jgi:hypothetical protein
VFVEAALSGALLVCLLLMSVLAGGAGGATAVTSGNLVRNGGAEVGAAAVDDAHVVAPAGWTTTGVFTAVRTYSLEPRTV